MVGDADAAGDKREQSEERGPRGPTYHGSTRAILQARLMPCPPAPELLRRRRPLAWRGLFCDARVCRCFSPSFCVCMTGKGRKATGLGRRREKQVPMPKWVGDGRWNISTAENVGRNCGLVFRKGPDWSSRPAVVLLCLYLRSSSWTQPAIQPRCLPYLQCGISMHTGADAPHGPPLRWRCIMNFDDGPILPGRPTRTQCVCNWDRAGSSSHSDPHPQPYSHPQQPSPASAVASEISAPRPTLGPSMHLCSGLPRRVGTRPRP